MEAEKNPLEAVRAMMIDTLEKSRSATQSYLDLVERTMRGFPNIKEEQVNEFKAYVERQVAANHAFVDRLLRAKDFQEAFRIQGEHFQSQLKAAAEDAARLGAKMAGSFNRPTS
ncbi:phasin family protein [Bradyrhizobium lablabi]|uniref:phasin family protein n=1 Tax=Bradyrhizobium lablabi TaxID=722472 RepID=UPI001BAA1350|nr:phasin family protein [Bradyrhizobium lablabi]MBR0695628.1 phasin family protein [Bradyrhizobium lablabi]